MKTAVEWLVEQLNQKIDYIPLDKWDMIRHIVLQAKELEKEMIIKAFNEGESLGDKRNCTGIVYYKETFKSE
jgi:hypothetical protein